MNYELNVAGGYAEDCPGTALVSLVFCLIIKIPASSPLTRLMLTFDGLFLGACHNFFHQLLLKSIIERQKKMRIFKTLP